MRDARRGEETPATTDDASDGSDIVVAPDGGEILDDDTEESQYEQLREVYTDLVDRAEELKVDLRENSEEPERTKLAVRREEVLDAIQKIEPLLNEWADPEGDGG